jgi:hypothetical protein
MLDWRASSCIAIKPGKRMSQRVVDVECWAGGRIAFRNRLRVRRRQQRTMINSLKGTENTLTAYYSFDDWS